MEAKQAEKKAPEYPMVELVAEHIHRGRHYKPNDVLKLRDDQAQRLIIRKIGKPAAKDAKPLNVDANGKLF